jgi:hypothetical protein
MLIITFVLHKKYLMFDFVNISEATIILCILKRKNKRKRVFELI